MSGLVTVYMPTKDREDLLPRAVGSVLGQTHAELELIVVDDGSRDGTRAYLDALSARDARVKVVHNERACGAPYARNLALRMGRGEFATGLDDDDMFHPDRLRRMLEAWRTWTREGPPLSALYSQDLIVKGARSTETRKPALIRADELYFHNQVGNQIFTRREYLLEVGGFDEALPAWQDLDTFIRVLRRYGPARLVDAPLYHLYVDPRPDRISFGASERLMEAYARLSAKSTDATPAMKQALFLQMFGELYGASPSLSQLREFFRYGVDLRNLKRLLGVYVRRLTGVW